MKKKAQISYNDIGISRRLDLPCVRHLLCVGLFSAILTLIGDMLLGWDVEDETLTGLPRMLSAYITRPTKGLQLRRCLAFSVSRPKGCAISVSIG